MDTTLERSKNGILHTLIVGLIILVLTGCNSTKTEDESLQIVATTTMLYDLVENIAGSEIECIGLMGVGIDPHLYKASAGDVSKLESADMIVYNGLHLEGEMEEIFQQLGDKGKMIVCASDGLEVSQLLNGEEGQFYDPHIWFDVTLWMNVAQHLTEEIVALDGDNEDVYRENLEAYLLELEDLQEYVLERTSEIAKEHRVIITAHDAFSYLGNAYDFEVMGLQGISTEAETSTSDISGLAAYISQHGIKAIFIESSVPTKNVEALQEAVEAKGFQVEIGGELYSDSLGDASQGHDSYVEAFKSNINTIVDGLK